jgi:hypothetical protein
VRFRVLIDGQPPGAAHGIDVDEQGDGTVSEQRLYQLIRQPKPIADRQFEIEFSILAWRLMRSRSADPRHRLFTYLPREKPFLETGLPVLGSFGT